MGALLREGEVCAEELEAREGAADGVGVGLLDKNLGKNWEEALVCKQGHVGILHHIRVFGYFPLTHLPDESPHHHIVARNVSPVFGGVGGP